MSATRAQQSSRARSDEAELAELLAGLAKLAAETAPEPVDALEAEQWASSLIGMMQTSGLPGESIESVFVPPLIRAFEDLCSEEALAALRAIGAICAPENKELIRGAGDRLAATGLAEPPWVERLGQTEPTAAALMCEEAFDDGVSVMVEFAEPNANAHTIGIYIDHNLGGIVKDVFLAGSLTDVRDQLQRQTAGEAGVTIRDLDLAEARARVDAALYMLDHTYDPPITEDVRSMRALMATRMRLLPEGLDPPEDHVDVTPEERDALLEDFLSSPEGRTWHGDEDAEDVAGLAIEFGADYNHGGPLRWSPVVVELFMTSWLARKVTREPEFFERVPDVLCDWVAYAGRRRGVGSAPLREAVGAVDTYRAEMRHSVNDPEAWGPAKAFAVAALDAGVDLTDRDEVERFIGRYNDGLAA